MTWCDAFIPLAGVVVFGVGAFAVAVVECWGDKDELRDYLRPPDPVSSRKPLWKPLLGGLCAGVLAGGAVAEFTTSGFGKGAEEHPVLASFVTGALLAVITVLVIEALVSSFSTRSWHSSLAATSHSAVTLGRRGVKDLEPYLAAGAVQRLVPRRGDEANERSEEAYEEARRLWVDLGNDVSRASLTAFAAAQPELGELMNELLAAASRLQRALQSYSSDKESESERGKHTTRTLEQRWGAYLRSLIKVDDKARKDVKGYSSPIDDRRREWMRKEIARTPASEKKSTTEATSPG
jgi:hypothetical protein